MTPAEKVADEQSDRYGRAQIIPMREKQASIVIGMTDDIEFTHLFVPDDPACTIRAATADELRRAREEYR